MFTGIIDQTGRVLERTPTSIRIQTTYPDLALGESVAIDGVCLTVAELGQRELGPKTEALFFISPETLQRSNLNRLQVGCRCNLERALQMQTRLSGHWVQGHVDGVGKLVAITPVTSVASAASFVSESAECMALRIELPRELIQFCVEKGSVTVNGISLTINRVTDSHLELLIIPHTWKVTNLSDFKVGDAVNIEVDVLAKLVARQVEVLCRSMQLSVR